jgi:hypothetical protein
MKRVILLAGVVLLMAAMMALAGAAWADPIQDSNPGQPQATRSGNCVGVLSAAITGNGGTVRDEGRAGVRDEFIKSYHSQDC